MAPFIPNRTPLVNIPKDELLDFIKSFTPEKLANLIDVTGLKPDTGELEMKKLAKFAKKHKCASVCVYPNEGLEILPLLLKRSNVKNCYVIDFPLGMNEIEMKATQAAGVVKKNRELRNEGKGKIDLDLVINVDRFKTDPHYTLEEINAVCEVADGEVVKVIVRTSELTEKEIWKVSEIVAESKAQFIKTSTGMDDYGALPDHVWIMRQVLGNEKGVKAAGGISNAITAIRLLWAGARDSSLQTPDKFRLGSSNPMNIISTMSLLLSDTEALVTADVIPCFLCPVYHTAKHRVDLRESCNKRCEECIHKEYRLNKFTD
jgi:deoxyribose-phosphate aldolase